MLRVLLATLWMPLLCIAQTPESKPETAPAPVTIAPVKIGWINLDAAMVNCEEGKKMWADIQKYVEAQRTELAAINKEAETLKTKLEVQGPKLTDEARLDLQNQADEKSLMLQRAQEDSQKEFENRRMRMMNYIGKRMQPVIEKVAQKHNLNAILIFDSGRDAWVDPSLNMTEEVINMYNQTHAAASSKAAPKPAAAPAKTP